MTIVCPSCAATNSCPDAAAGLTVCCRKCKTQVTLPEAPEARAPRWHATRYWRGVLLAEVLALAGLVACILLYTRGRPPAGLPLLPPGLADSADGLAQPGDLLTLEWATNIESANGSHTIEGQRLVLCGSGERELREVAVRQERWTHEVFQPDAAPDMEPVVLELQVRLPDAPELVGESVALRAAADIEYPGRARPGGPVTVQRAAVTGEWKFAFATIEQQKTLARYTRGRGWTQAGIVLFAAMIPAVGFAAGLFAHRHLSIQCPKCSRITIATYYLGGTRLRISPCPHYGTRPVEARRG
ncbi:MAG: hypothetical protein FJ290_01700 [Planctomycetes bacterium]|nr:hypothetical protein [Planctomycetota bacterium]